PSQPLDAIFINAGVTSGISFIAVTTTDSSGIAVNSFGNLTLENSQISGNNGTGIDAQGGSTLTLRNSTVSGNADGVVVDGDADATDANPGGGLFSDTVSNNTGVGVFTGAGSASLTNTIVANNVSANCNTPVAAVDHSLSNTSACGSVVVGNPLLGTPQNTGGPTLTRPPPFNTPARDAGTNTGVAPCPATDQRGVARNDGLCDIGAYEFKDTTAPTITKTPTGNQNAQVPA